ncbi:MAG: hypothetical protein WAW11_02425 [Patescibacteria group bacterium]|jgi:uncharacterized membrane protein YvbJ
MRDTSHRSSGPILIGAALLILIAIFGYFGYQLDRQEKQLNTLQTAVLDDGAKIQEVVNFINNSLSNAQQQAK